MPLWRGPEAPLGFAFLELGRKEQHEDGESDAGECEQHPRSLVREVGRVRYVNRDQDGPSDRRGVKRVIHGPNGYAHCDQGDGDQLERVCVVKVRRNKAAAATLTIVPARRCSATMVDCSRVGLIATIAASGIQYAFGRWKANAIARGFASVSARITANRTIGRVSGTGERSPGMSGIGGARHFHPRASHTAQARAIQTADPASHASVCADNADMVKKHLFETLFIRPISEYELLLATGNHEFPMPWTGDEVRLVALIWPGLINAARMIPANAIASLIDQVRNRILTFSLEIEQQNPDAGEAPPGAPPIPETTVSNIFHNTIIGDHAVISTGGLSRRSR